MTITIGTQLGSYEIKLTAVILQVDLLALVALHLDRPD